MPLTTTLQVGQVIFIEGEIPAKVISDLGPVVIVCQDGNALTLPRESIWRMRRPR